jgi:GWxTD domain-containing protein
MRHRWHLFVVIWMFSVQTILAGDPAAAIAAGREAINNKQYDIAIQTLSAAVPDAAMLPEPQRTQALAAVDFFTAVAFSGMGNDAKAREQLDHFFELSPKTNTIDPGKYDKAFVRRFNEVRAAFDKTATGNFDLAYPGYRSFKENPSSRPLNQWGDGPDLVLLGTSEEKQEWKSLQDDESRRRFIEQFWFRRDRTPDAAENEFQRDFMRRVAFADNTFVTEKTRGSLTDRGRVFVLLGPPKIVRQSNLTAADGARVQKPQMATTSNLDRAPQARAVEARDRNMTVLSSAPIPKGKVERWVYGRDQLPKGFPDDQLVFKFITEEGYGENVLQRDHLVVKAMHDAGKTE